MNPEKLARQLNEGAAFHQKGDLVNAEKNYREVLKKLPQQPDALHLLGVLLDQRGDRAKGIELVRKAIGVQSSFPDAHVNLARMLLASGDAENAKKHYDLALAIKPGHARAHNGLGVLYRAQGQYKEAVAAFERTIRFEPRWMDAYLNLCNTYRDTSDEAGILRVAAEGLAADPNCAPLWLIRSEASFTLGDLAAGWRDYAWRFRTPQNPVVRQNYPLPLWQGEDLTDKGILVWTEQAPGEEILFGSMIASVAARARRCVVQTTPRLLPLFRRSFSNVEFHAGPVPDEIVAGLDVQCSLGDLGQWLRGAFRGFPAQMHNLKADAARVANLRAKYARPGKLLVGLAWKSANVLDAAQKTVDLSQWGAVLNVPGVTFINLQYGDNRAEIATARSEFGAEIIEDADVDSLVDLDAFAAQVAAMDLVISSSNTAAHFAGALGVPTFCLIPRALGSGRRWYWFGDGRYSPWYSAMTLFRQSRVGAWTDVLANVGLALTGAAHAAGALANPVDYLERLGKGFLKAGLATEALKVYGEALSLHTAHDGRAVGLNNSLGMTLARLGRYDDAVQAYERALSISPQEAEVLNNLGTAYRRVGRPREASANYAKAHALKPEHPSIFLNHAMVLSELDELEAALAALDALVALKPDYVDAQYNRAIVLMGLGRLREGWEAFKWRMKRPGVHVHHDAFPQPVWAGEDLKDKHVLVWTDLGLGEEILLAGVIPDLAAAARRVTLLCSERLLPLFRRSFPKVTVERRVAPLPPAALSEDIDFQMSIAELGVAFRPDFAAFPARQHYLAVDEKFRGSLRKKYQQAHPGQKIVGISWRSINPEIGAIKSIPLEAWLPLLRTPGVTFVNLQYGDTREEVAALARDHGITLLTDPTIDSLGDMDKVAAQMAAMDHVVTISNTTAHVCGAVGVPVSVLLPPGYARLWYWFRGLGRCAWYPSATLLAAEQAGEWERILAACADTLRQTP